VRRIVDTGAELVRGIARSHLPDCRTASTRRLGEGQATSPMRSTGSSWVHARCPVIGDLAYGLETGPTEYATKSLGALDGLFGRAAHPDRR
jgi:hypothetical protein